MNIIKKNLKRFLAVLLTMSVIVPSVSELNVLAEGENITLEAGIYKDADRKNKIVDLSAEGAMFSGWEYNTDRYLGVTISDLPMTGDEQYKLVIEMAPILYLNQNSDPKLGSTTVSFTKNEDLVVNTDSTYVLKEYSLSNLTYLIDKGTQELTLGLPLRFDNALWNKQDGAILANGEKPLLRVYLQQVSDAVVITGCDLKLKEAMISGSIPDNPSVAFHLANSDYETALMGIDERIRMNVGRASNIDYSEGYYCESIDVVLELPTCTVDGVEYQLLYEDFKFTTSGGTSKYNISEEDGKLHITAEKMFFKSSGVIQTWFTAPDSLKSVIGRHVFSGKVKIVADGITIVPERSFSVTVDNDSKADIRPFSFTGTANVLEHDTVQPMGNLSIRNASAFTNGSGQLEVSLGFDSNHTNTIGITTVNMVSDRDSEYIDVYYTLVDQAGNLYEDGKEYHLKVKNTNYNPDSTDTDNKYVRIKRKDLPTEHQAYFFKTLRYSIGNLDGNTKGYHSGAGKAPYSAGTIWGYVHCDEIPAEMPKHSMKVYKIIDENTKELISGTDIQVSVQLDEGTTVAFGMSGAKVSGEAIVAGDSFTISGSIFVTEYPYTSNSCLNDIRLGLILPVGVEVNKSSISVKYTNGTVLEVEEVIYKPIESDSSKRFCIIKFKAGQKIGWFNEALAAIPNGSSLNYTLQLNTDKAMSTQTIILRESVFVSGDKRENGAGGSYADNAWPDTYDLNENGKSTDKVGCFNDTTTKSITIQSSLAQLEITDSLRKADRETGSSLTIDSFADTVHYDLTVKCTQGGSASGFYYYIPIAKKAIINEDILVQKNQVELKLKDAAAVINTNGTKLKCYYTTQSISRYADTASLTEADWFEELPAGASWEDVTMIKVVAVDETIINGSENLISLPLGYAGVDKEYELYAGMQVAWKSRGYYSYKNGANTNAGMRNTAGVEVTLVYTPEEPIEFTLTAAKGEPQGEGAVKTYAFELPQFILAQEYSIEDIKPVNMTLVDEKYDFSKADSVAANNNFRINVSVKEKADVDYQNAVSILKDGTVVGELQENEAPMFRFELENADALSDVVTNRYVELILIGNNGVIVPVKINIKCEMAEADATKPAIVAGEQYRPFDGDVQAMVSQDSAFTAQFVTENLIPDNYTDWKISFNSTKAPAEGTKITLIDWTDTETLKFYHYTLDGKTTQIDLTSFEGMGASQDYAEPTGQEPVTERLLFIVQFPKSGESIRENTLELSKVLKENNTVDKSTALTFTTVAKRTFKIQSDKTNVNQGEDFTLTYTTKCSVIDSRYTSRNFAYVISAKDGNALPVDSKLKVGEKIYHLNSKGEFIIPLDSVQKNDVGERSIQYSSTHQSQVELSVALHVSATASGENPMMGENGIAVAGPVYIVIHAKEYPSFKVLSMSRRLIHRDELMEKLTTKYDLLNVDDLKVEVQKKDGKAYITQSNIVEQVNGSSSHTQGVFVIANKSGDLTIKLNENAPSGTYRVLFTASNKNQAITIPYNFIIK